MDGAAPPVDGRAHPIPFQSTLSGWRQRAGDGTLLLLVAAALARVCAAIHPAWSVALLRVAGGAWSGAFVGFALTYWKVFTGPRAAA